MPGMALSSLICRWSYGTFIFSLFFSSRMVVVPIGWSGSCRRISSSSTSMFHELAKDIARFRAGSGIVQCLLSLSQRACGNDVFRAVISSLL